MIAPIITFCFKIKDGLKNGKHLIYFERTQKIMKTLIEFATLKQ